MRFLRQNCNSLYWQQHDITWLEKTCDIICTVSILRNISKDVRKASGEPNEKLSVKWRISLKNATLEKHKHARSVYLIINSRENRNKRAYKARARVLKGHFEAFEQQPVVAEGTFAYYNSRTQLVKTCQLPKLNLTMTSRYYVALTTSNKV